MDARPTLATARHAGRPDRSPNRMALVAAMVGVAVVTLDISLTSTALPAIARGLGVAPATAVWLVNIYYLAVVAALLPLAALGESYWQRRIFLLGLAAFAAGSLASGLAPSLPALMAARALVGMGAAAVSATTPALIRALYPPERMGRGLGLYALVVGVAFTAGPPAASAVLAVADWPWLYFQNALLALLALALAIRGLPETERFVRRFDLAASLLCSLGFAALLFAVAGTAHLTAPPLLAALALFVLSAGLLLKRETGHPAPILGADLFRRPLFALASLTAIFAFSVQGLVFVALPFLFQTKLGFTQVEAGLLIMPWPATLIVMTMIAARLAERVPPGLLAGLGLLLLAAGLVLLARLPAGADDVAIGGRLVFCGVGFGLFQSPNMAALMRSAPPARSGSAGGILAMSRLFGQSLGAAVVAYWLAARPADGVETAIWSAAAFACIGAAVSLARLLPAVRRGGGA